MKQEKNPKRRLIGAIVFYVITALLVFFIAANIIAPNNAVNITGFQLSVVPTPSMETAINPGDVIILVKADKDNIDVNDIVVFNNYRNGQYLRIVHRVISVEEVNNEKRYVTRGDNNQYADNDVDNGQGYRDENGDLIEQYLTNDDILAEAVQMGQNNWVLRIPGLGYPVIWIQNFGRILVANPIFFLLIVFNLAIIITLIVYLVKTSKKNSIEGKKEESSRIKANDITSDSEHSRNDDEEDGSA